MDFALNEEQAFLQSTVHELLSSECTLDHVRDIANGDTSNAQLRSRLAALSVPGVLVPEEYGGVGLGLLEAALIAEALGGAAAPVPYLGTSVMAVVAVLLSGSDAQKNDYLWRLAAGELTIGVAIADHTGRRDSGGIQSTNGRLRGDSMFVLEAEEADALIVADEDRNLHIVEFSDVEVSPLKTIDRTRSVSRIEMNAAAADPLNQNQLAAATVVDRILDAGRVMIAADTLGAAQVMLDKAVEYAGERRQFNRVIGSFQAVKHMCSEMAADLEPCRSFVWYAAHAQSVRLDDCRLATLHAKAHLAEVGRFVARKSTEVHGGMGFTDLLGLHYWFKRIELNRQLLGTPEFVRNVAAQIQGWIE